MTSIDLPMDLQAEAIILGRMMSSINVANDVFDVLNETDFFLPEHQTIFRAMLQLFKTEAEIEPISICRIAKSLDKNFKDDFLVYGLEVHRSSYGDDATHFIEVVKECSILRRLIAQGREMMTKAGNRTISASQLQSEITANLDLIFNEKTDNSLHHVGSAYLKEYRDSGKNFLQYIEKKQEDYLANRCTLSGYPSGYPILDETLDGFNKGHFIIIGARPGVGKTTFILNLIKGLIGNGLRIGFFSLEATLNDIALSYACLTAGIDSKAVKQGKINPYEFTQLASAVSSIHKQPFFLDEKGSLKISQVMARTKRMIANHGIQVLFVDYIGEVKGDSKFVNKQEEMQVVSRGLRAIAKQMNIPVICVAQLNRQSEINNRIPTKADLRESGQIEADAHSIIMLHRPDQADPNNYPGILNAHIVKNRYGEEKKISFNFNKSTGYISELEKFVTVKEAMERQDDPFEELRKR